MQFVLSHTATGWYNRLKGQPGLKSTLNLTCCLGKTEITIITRREQETENGMDNEQKGEKEKIPKSYVKVTKVI